jgi:hypothetical protein
MAHSIPKNLHGEERYFTIPILNVHFGRKGVMYNGLVTLLSVGIGKLTNTWVFLVFFIVLNLIAYPLAHMRVMKSKFEGGNKELDRYFLSQYKYKHFGRKVYLRKRGE